MQMQDEDKRVSLIVIGNIVSLTFISFMSVDLHDEERKEVQTTHELKT